MLQEGVFKDTGDESSGDVNGVDVRRPNISLTAASTAAARLQLFHIGGFEFPFLGKKNKKQRNSLQQLVPQSVEDHDWSPQTLSFMTWSSSRRTAFLLSARLQVTSGSRPHLIKNNGAGVKYQQPGREEGGCLMSDYDPFQFLLLSSHRKDSLVSAAEKKDKKI